MTNERKTHEEDFVCGSRRGPDGGACWPGCCSPVPKAKSAAGTGIAAGGRRDLLSGDQAESILRGAKAVQKTWQDLTPEQEYYIGRAVAAQVFQTYRPLDRPAANAYLNLFGQSLAVFSDRPETFGGYHFLLLDSDEINAFAAPGGLILVTRGMVRCCENEDELAAVLAHEICHVEKKHGLERDQAGPSDGGVHDHRRGVHHPGGRRSSWRR